MLFHEFGLRFTWIMTFIFDIVVFGLTIARTYQYAKAHSRMRMHSDLTFLLMRDGSIYFLVMSIVNAANYILSIRIRNSFFASATGTNSILANVISVTMISRLLLNLREESVQYNRRSASRSRSSTIPTLTDTNLIFTSRIIGNLTADLDYESVGSFHARDGSENYYGYSGEESDELYELQSRSTRSGITSRSKYSGRSMLSDPGSSSGTGTIAGSPSGSGSGADSGMSRIDRTRQSKLTWDQSANTASSSTAGRHRMDGLLSPTTAVESHLGLLPSGERSPQLLSPLSPATSRSIAPALDQPTTLVSPHPTSPISPDRARDLAFITMSRSEDWDGNVERGSSGNRERARQRMHFHSAGTDEAIEMSSFKRQTRPEGSYDHDLYHDHYRRAPHSLPDT
ncbi:uncharacterized protein FOMMEDRAFT_166003 [Fomitiporia mediterranea MF3/22]|uniref:uncharacterized protein n=1 Tax=Fomitiporia mediterranea (strain MF3/22) TaxID=694068 RepID=UPI00044090E0|nr:uncharacterized protein FOMMEDRAFT_166003 [Fomitiporia mediterranea MF3/22]EJD05631.1 hypothetical protein FOMMEDRAFT_166003 [Fomitiporia mediterranea MF3/22]